MFEVLCKGHFPVEFVVQVGHGSRGRFKVVNQSLCVTSRFERWSSNQLILEILRSKNRHFGKQ